MGILENIRHRLYNIKLGNNIIKAGLKGFGPLTTGLRVRCATWLRHRPTEMNMPRVVINLKIVK